MPEFLAHEGLEHAERAHEHLQGTSDPLLRFIPIAAAILAVLAGLASLYGGRLAERQLELGSSAVLAQTRASDTWAEYQAQSLKAHINAAALAVAANASTRAKLAADMQSYRQRQPPLMQEATKLENERTQLLDSMDKVVTKKLDVDVGVALFQISIVLASVAAMTKRPPLFIAGLVGGAIGLIYCVVGLLR
ncbi:MAG: DUF4337 family protein [Candidatus Eremiobacteraeota bacterium]|nr:DUF4337 family protein [Candidatus Eremiobacteraeota bacterium]